MNSYKAPWVLLIMLLMHTASYGQSESSANPVVIKVLTFNILHGATTNNDFDLDAIAKVIIDSDADLVALQEVDFKTNRAKNYDLVTELGQRTKMAPLFGRAMPYDGGEYGEGILSKWSFISTRNVLLPYFGDHEPRAALEITTVLPTGDTISFVGTHLDHLRDSRDRIAQVQKINQAFLGNKYPTILAGDLNDVPGSEAINILEEFWQASYQKEHIEPTYSSANPTKKIDYIMHYPEGKWRVLEQEVICDKIASDHCSLLVTIELLR